MNENDNKTDRLTIDFGQWQFDTDSTDKQNQSDSEELGEAKIDDNPLYYISFGSGSSGNSCYLGTRNSGIIIDAGVKTEDVVAVLKDNGIDMAKIKGVCLTHDHADHIRYAYNMVRKNKHMHVFCTNRVLNGILRRHNISKRIKDYHVPIFKEIPFKIGDFEITAFDVPHDGSDNMGFSITNGNRTFVVATDLGKVTDRARHYMSKANYLMIEANYDLQMLLNGSYPEFLKARIQTENGHLDNSETASFLRQIASKNLHNVFLCHLSHDNNTPEKALEIVRMALQQSGLKIGDATDDIDNRDADIQLMALPRYDATRRFVFRD